MVPAVGKPASLFDPSGPLYSYTAAGEILADPIADHVGTTFQFGVGSGL